VGLRWERLQRLSVILAGFKGPTSNVGEAREGEGGSIKGAYGVPRTL